jgi:hypothetical protein
MPETTSATSQATVTPSPVGDLNSELQNLIDWSDETPDIRDTAVCTTAISGCHDW